MVGLWSGGGVNYSTYEFETVGKSDFKAHQARSCFERYSGVNLRFNLIFRQFA